MSSDADTAKVTAKLGLCPYRRSASDLVRCWSVPLTLSAPDPSVVTTPKILEPWTADKVLATMSVDKPTEGSYSPVPYFHTLERLKTTKREGWKRFGINQ